MRRLLLAPRILALSLPAMAGLPESRQGKWMKAKDSPTGIWFIDIEDVDVRGAVLRFWVERSQGKEEKPDPNMRPNWSGKIRIICEKFTARNEIPDGRFGSFRSDLYSKIKPNCFAYTLANNFCFLTGVGAH